VGYQPCPNGHIASNMIWCKSLTEWMKQYSNWMKIPGEINNDISSIFFDYEIAFGEQKLEDAITDIIFVNTRKNKLFFDYLGNDALRKPPALSFFKKINIEETGPNKGKFDIKNRALLPLIDGARLFVISYNIRGINNTYMRFKHLAMVDLKNSETYMNCAEAYQSLTKIKTTEGLRYDNSGQFINLEDLNKVDKENLKNALNTIKDLEELIKDSFQLTQFS